MSDIVKAGLLVLDGDRVLLCRKRTQTNLLILPGGKIEPNESPEDCLRRECREELGPGGVPNGLTYLGSYRAAAAGDLARIVQIELFAGTLPGIASASGEIEELVWFGPSDSPAALAPSLRWHIFPDLIQKGILPWPPSYNGGVA